MAKKQAVKSRVEMTTEEYKQAVRNGWNEAQFLKEVLALAKRNGWRSFHQRPGMTAAGKWISAVQGDGIGFPDVVLIRGGALRVLELKVGKNTTTAAQDAWLKAFNGVEGDVASQVVYPRDWTMIEAILA